jgi:membrane-bound lytic murein transglycosylase D
VVLATLSPSSALGQDDWSGHGLDHALIASVPLPPEAPPAPARPAQATTREALESPSVDTDATPDADGVVEEDESQIDQRPDAADVPLDPGEEPSAARPQPEVTPDLVVPPYPIVVNRSVESLIDYFTARERDRFAMWVGRSSRYLDMIRQTFRAHGLPDELAYTAMIESGFSPRAVSRAGAKGMWQFMDATARRYGLVIDRWVDERLDPVRSTAAAARYLSDLYGMFGHWFLAQAAYNAGEARVARAIERARTTDFWALSQTRHLPNETKLFVPQILAAMLISRDPARYGFDVAMDPPLAYDAVTVPEAIDIGTAAALAGVAPDEVADLNPALRTGVTPPYGPYALRVPPGAGPRLQAALETAALPRWSTHRVRHNQTLEQIARMYRANVEQLVQANRLVGSRLRSGQELLVPIA